METLDEFCSYISALGRRQGQCVFDHICNRFHAQGSAGCRWLVMLLFVDSGGMGEDAFEVGSAYLRMIVDGEGF